MGDKQSAELMARWRGGDEQAADALFERHAERLLALVRTRLRLSVRTVRRRLDQIKECLEQRYQEQLCKR